MFKKKLLSLLILFIMSFALVSTVGAATLKSTILEGDEMKKVSTDVYDANNNTPKQSIEDIIVVIINSVLGLLGVIFLIIIIYAGFLWMTAGGNDEQVGKAKKLLINSIIGVVIIVGAYAISYFVLSAVLG